MTTPNICIPSSVIEKEITLQASYNNTNELPYEYKFEILKAYGFAHSYSKKSAEEMNMLNEKIAKLAKSKKTYANLISVIYSNRHPYTVMSLAANIGMYIPGSKRYGIVAYEFYLANVKYYETLIPRSQPPTLKEIYLNENKYELLSSLKDDQILISNYIYSINYSDRQTMIKNFIKANVDIYGYFSLPSNTRSFYNSDALSIFYSVSDNLNHSYKESYSTSEFLKLIDEKEKCVYTNSTKNIKYNNLALLGLRKCIIEKLAKWRSRDNNDEIGSTKLYKILTKLENILENESRINSDICLKFYTISTS